MPTGLALTIPILVFLMTIGIGTDLTAKNFRDVVTQPRGAIVGLVAQLILLPLVGFGVAWLFRGDPSIALGIVLLAACPGGPLSNSLSYVARGNVQLSISLTAVSGFLALITTPTLAIIGLDLFSEAGADPINLPIGPTIGNIAGLVILPTIIGMLLRHKFPQMISRNADLIRRGCTLLMLAAVIVVVVVSYQTLVENLSGFLAATVLLLVGLYITSRVLAHLFVPDDDTRFTIVAETVIQNVVIAAIIAVAIIERPELALFSAVYSAPTAVLMALLALRRGRNAVS